MLQTYINRFLIKFGIIKKDESFIVREEIRENATWSDLRQNRIKQIKDDLESGNINVDQEIIEQSGQTLLTQSIVIDRYEIFLLCLLYKANVNQQTYEGMSPVHLAASLGRLKMLQDLKLYGAQFDAKDELGMTPLDRAILYNHSEVIEFLKQKQ
ncbi:unnamed protein product [Paramecium pentaurelia]|uniref:Ankyrin repeat protein n=1 Tax=Paramecium pentaurelia TaxID=43138 RepID=A0A8S1SBC1_9CILI|nr:unnamed protein product [Paramecium pentaurelia]